MSRLTDAQTKLTSALDALEAALTSRLDSLESNSADPQNPTDGDVDHARLLKEITRIDGQLSQAIQLIADAHRNNLNGGGTA